MKRLLAAMALGFLVLAGPQSASAGIPVFDYSNLLQAVVSYVQQTQQYMTQAQQYTTQLRQLAYQWEALQNDARNLRQMDSYAAQSTMYRIQDALYGLQTLTSKTRGIVLDYARVEGEFDRLYPDFQRYNGMSGRDYAQQALLQSRQTENAMVDAMKAQGLVANVKNDQEALRTLIQASRSSQGALSAAQVGNQIAALTAQQLMQLQTIISTSQRAQTSYLAEVNANDAAARAKATDVMKDFTRYGQGRVKASANPFK